MAEGKAKQPGAVASQRRTHAFRWLPRKRRTLPAVADRRAVTVGGRRGCGREREGQAVQQADQAAGPCRHGPCVRKARAAMARSLSPTLNRRQRCWCFPNATTHRSISKRGGFGRVPALVHAVPALQAVSASTSCAGPHLARASFLGLSRLAVAMASPGSRASDCRASHVRGSRRQHLPPRCSRNADSDGALVATETAVHSPRL